jgi:hypothetical protein
VSLVSLFSCTRAPSTNQSKAAEFAGSGADSVVYMLTVDSVSLPIRLKEMGDFPAYSKDSPYPLTVSGNSLKYKDTKYLHFLNGQMIEGRQKNRILRKLKADEVESIKYVPAEQGVQDYGQKAAHGIIFIEMRDKK